jgi:hypothetical protein
MIDPDTTTVEKVTNEADGIEAIISRAERGYAVCVRDLDSGLVLNTVRTFPELAAAREYAAGIAGKTARKEQAR